MVARPQAALRVHTHVILNPMFSTSSSHQPKFPARLVRLSRGKNCKMATPTNTQFRTRTDSTLSVIDIKTIPLLALTVSSTTLVENFPTIVEPSVAIIFEDEHSEPRHNIAETIASKIASLYRAAHRKIFKNSIYHQTRYFENA
jgi:hypothetical protein